MAKPNKMACGPSEDSDQPLCAQWVAKDPSFLHADNEDSDQTGRMLRLICVFAGRTCHFVGFVMRRLTLPILICMLKIRSVHTVQPHLYVEDALCPYGTTSSVC